MRAITWNVNSIKVRLERLLNLLDRHEPDVVCLQELKGTDDQFPYQALTDIGYHATVLGQKTYNGVAVLSREKPSDIKLGFGDDVDDPQARLAAALINDVWVISAYFPNGSSVGSEKYQYKLQWIDRLHQFLDQFDFSKQSVLLTGDMNMAYRAVDVANPDEWNTSVLFHPDMQERLKGLIDRGLRDVFGEQHPEGGIFSWWDYRQLAFPKNDGLRIDYILASEPMVKRHDDSWIDRPERKGQQPSDHAPVVADFN